MFYPCHVLEYLSSLHHFYYNRHNSFLHGRKLNSFIIKLTVTEVFFIHVKEMSSYKKLHQSNYYVHLLLDFNYVEENYIGPSEYVVNI